VVTVAKAFEYRVVRSSTPEGLVSQLNVLGRAGWAVIAAAAAGAGGLGVWVEEDKWQHKIHKERQLEMSWCVIMFRKYTPP